MKTVIIDGVEWSIDKVKETMQVSDKALYKGLLLVYSFQTKDEQRIDNTTHVNGKGFNSSDAFILSSFSTQLQKSGGLSEKQKAIARKKMVKYAGQIWKHICSLQKEEV